MSAQSGMNETLKGKCCCCLRPISWTAIIAGSLVAVGLSFLLQLFGISIDLSAFDMSQTGIASFAIGGFVAMLVGAIVAMYTAGWVTGYLVRFSTNPFLAAIYGFLTWSLALILIMLASAHVSHFVVVSNAALSNARGVAFSPLKDTTGMSVVDEDKRDTKSALKVRVLDQEKATNFVGISLFLTCILFLVGAISCCLGAYCGLQSKIKNRYRDERYGNDRYNDER